jgi:hypothetical protein
MSTVSHGLGNERFGVRITGRRVNEIDPVVKKQIQNLCGPFYIFTKVSYLSRSEAEY